MYNRISWEQFAPKPYERIKANKNGDEICSDFICLDTETSHENEIGWVYHWAFDYMGEIIFGRKPSQLIECFKKIVEVNQLGYDEQNDITRRIRIYVHNLSYDYQYIKDYFFEAFGKATNKTLATGSHKIISWEINGIEFRCSFRLTLKSLDTLSKELGVTRKLVGKVDHKKVRYQDSVLTNDDIDYLAYDIISLRECLLKLFELRNDNLLTVPYTVTGYVRREARKAYKKYDSKNLQFKKERLPLELYKMCKRENAGGITHGNRFLAEVTQRGCIRHRDFVSHYPSQQKCASAPSGRPCYYYHYDVKDVLSVEDLFNFKNKCFMAKMYIKDLTLRSDSITMPYAQYDKFYKGKVQLDKCIKDNGRIIYYKGICEVCVNEIDLAILVKQYTFSYRIVDVYTFDKKPYPKYIQETVDKYFYDKTLYKDKEREIEKKYGENSKEWIETHSLLMISKGDLNGIFGMTDTDPVHIKYEENDNGEWVSETMSDDDISDALNKYYSGWNNFMSYQLGVWTTANARKQLIELIELIGYENFIYCDTDSIFYFSTPEIEEKIENYNREKRELGDKNGWFVEVNGRKVYYNQFDLEDEDIISFKFLHSKCYAYEVRKIKDGKEVIELKTTIAGVKRNGRNDNTRVKELGNIDNLAGNFKFVDCGGTQIKYITHNPTTAYINNHLTEFASSAIIFDVEKVLHGMYTTDENINDWEIDYGEY